MSNRIGWIVAGAIAFVLVFAGGVTTLILASGGDPTTVQEVADEAVAAAEDLDVEAGVDLLCEVPGDGERRELERLIEAAQEESGTEDPDVDYEVSDIEGDAEGSFDVRVTSDEEEFEDDELAARVFVERRGERSCIARFENRG